MPDPNNDTTLRWDATGPYVLVHGQKHYYAPVQAAASDDPRLRQWGQSKGAFVDTSSSNPASSYQSGAPDSLMSTRGIWNPDTGQFDQGFDWGNLATIAAGGLLAGPAIAGALPAAGGAAPVGLATGQAPLNAGLISSAVAPAGGGGALAKFTFSDLIPTLIKGGLDVAGGAISSNAQQGAAETQSKAALEAAKIQAASADKSTAAQLQAAQAALDWQKAQFARSQAAFAPYAAYGAGALSELGRGLGVRPSMPPAGASTGGLDLQMSAPNSYELPSTAPPMQTPPLPTEQANPVMGPAARGLGADSPQVPAQSLTDFARGQTTSSVRPAQVGERRTIRGQSAEWDGTGWKAVA